MLATAFRLASGRFWDIVRPCPLIAASRRQVDRTDSKAAEGRASTALPCPPYVSFNGILRVVGTSDRASAWSDDARIRAGRTIDANRSGMAAVRLK
jgi:hypothetical protein